MVSYSFGAILKGLLPQSHVRRTVEDSQEYHPALSYFILVNAARRKRAIELEGTEDGHLKASLKGRFGADLLALRTTFGPEEPDLKLPGTATTSADGPKLMARAVVSALDGLLEAERLANVTGALAGSDDPTAQRPRPNGHGRRVDQPHGDLLLRGVQRLL